MVVPPTPVWVLSQWQLAPTVHLSANDKGDKEVKLEEGGDVHRSSGILQLNKPQKISARGPSDEDYTTVIISNGVPYIKK